MRLRPGVLAGFVIAAACANAQDPEFVRTWEAAQRARPATIGPSGRIAGANRF